ncbi:MAG: peroxidase [Bacteroidota bacterium]
MNDEEADRLVDSVARNWQEAPLSDEDRALCAFAAKLTHEQYKMVPSDLDILRTHGFSDRAIHDAVQVIGFFNYITRIADSLGVEPEDFIRPWGA